MICSGVSVGSLPTDNRVYVLVLLVVWVRRPALGAAGSWVVLGLGFRWRASWECSLIDTPWGQGFSGGLVSWTQYSHSSNSGPTFGQGTKIPQAVCYGNKGD